MKIHAVLGLSLFALAACGGSGGTAQPKPPVSTKPAAPSAGEILDQVLAGDHRTAEERARDAHRHPKETLMFFGVEPNMTVVEISPGGGWYTQVIAPYLKEGGGKLYTASASREGASERTLTYLNNFENTYVKNPDVYGDVEMSVLGGDSQIAPEGTADVVLTFRNVHNWQLRGTENEVFAAAYRALKPGGVFGVIEHRADGADLPDDGSSGYVETAEVKAIADAVGFDFDRSSEINANPADTKDHPFGVWTLPPARRSSAVRGNEDPDFDRPKYDAIGESDRMTLMFRKPAGADGALYE